MFIYKIVNKVNGKEYIGKTQKSNVMIRWKAHIADSKRGKTMLYNAIKKYGIDAFEIYPIERVMNASIKTLNEREKYWIEVLEPEYNMTKGGDGGQIHDQTGRTWKVRDTSRMKNKKTITEKVLLGRKKISSGNNYQSKYYIFTPWGSFETWSDAEKAAQKERDNGNTHVIVDKRTISKYCLNNIMLNPEGRKTHKEWRGRYTRDIGFYIVNKNTKEENE